MKKLIITSLSVLAFAIAFTGCGGSGSVTDAADSVGDSVNNVVSPVVSEAAAIATTPDLPLNLSSSVGTPPGLPE